MADSDVIDTIIAEALGDGTKGMTAVAWTIANRAAQMGISPAQVVRQKSQFEGYSNPGSKAKQAQDNPAIRQRVEKIWSDVVNGRVPDPTHGGTMFHAASMTPYWADEANKHGTVRIGNQIYYKGSGGNPALAAIQSVAPSPRPPDLDNIRLAYVPTPAERPSFLDAASAPRVPSDLGTRLALNPATQAVPDINIGRYSGPAFDTSYLRNNNPHYATTEGARPFASPANAFGLSISDMVRGRSAAPPIPADAFQRVTARNTALLSRPTNEQAPVPADAYQRITARNNAILSQITPTPIPGYTDLQAMMPAPQPAFSKPASTTDPATRVASSSDLDMFKALRAVPSAPPAPTIAYADIPDVPGPAALPKAQDRLMPSPAGLPANYGTTPQQVAVATQLDTLPPPIPQNRPRIPIPQVPDLPKVAPPVPAARLQRPTSILPGIKLPGVLGLAQGISAAMNNASGPFNNGADNLLYDIFRGGNFTAPGAATAIGTNGFLYAPRQGGGWVNVGRAPGFTFNPVGTGQSSPDAIHSGGGHVYNPDTHDWERDLT